MTSAVSPAPLAALPVNQQMTGPVLAMLAKLQKPLTRTQNILDFGCGTGRHVYEFRDSGYRAFGVDLNDYLALREPEDRQWFKTSNDPDVYRIPFPDEHFDVIYSTQVFEHLRYYEPALKEMRRVLRPGGVCIHVFPSKWRPLETHFRIPLGGVFKTSSWLNLWTHLGCKAADAPPNIGPRLHARRYWEECRTNLNYLSQRELRFYAGMFFGKVEFMEREFVEATASTSGFSRLLKPLIPLPTVEFFYRHFHTKVMVLSGYSSYAPVWPIGWKPGCPSICNRKTAAGWVGRHSPQIDCEACARNA